MGNLSKELMRTLIDIFKPVSLLSFTFQTFFHCIKKLISLNLKNSTDKSINNKWSVMSVDFLFTRYLSNFL